VNDHSSSQTVVVYLHDLQEYQHGMLIDCIDDSQVNICFFLLFRKMYGERVNPDLGHMVIDLSGLSPRKIHEEKGWVKHMFDLW